MIATRIRSIPVIAAAALLASCGGEPQIPAAHGGARLSNGELGPGRLGADVCRGVDMQPEYGALDEDHVAAFLKSHGFKSTKRRLRADLVLIDVLDGAKPVQLRVAILDTPNGAGRELHEAILQHGTGAWGVHRANIAVLAPAGEVDDVVAFAVRTKLACWGVLTMAGRDDTFVIPGGYREL